MPGHRGRRGREVRRGPAPDLDGAGGPGPLHQAGAGGGSAPGGEHGQDHRYGWDGGSRAGSTRAQHWLSHHCEITVLDVISHCRWMLVWFLCDSVAAMEMYDFDGVDASQCVTLECIVESRSVLAESKYFLSVLLFGECRGRDYFVLLDFE